MKELYFHNGHYGYYKKCYSIQGWGNMGAIAVTCESKNIANTLAEEYRIEDDAKVVVKEAYVFTFIKNENKYIAKREERIRAKDNEPLLRGFVEYWDGTRTALKGTRKQFESLNDGVKIVFWNSYGDKTTIRTDYIWGVA